MMKEFLSQPSPEQLILGGLLAIIQDYSFDFEVGFFENDEPEDMINGVASALYEIGEDAGKTLKDYGVIEEGEDEI